MPWIPSNFAIALRGLIELEFDNTQIYEAIIKRVQSSTLKGQFQRFQLDLERHIRELTHLLMKHDEKPARYPKAFDWLMQGKSILSGPVDDRSIVRGALGLAVEATVHYQAMINHPNRWEAAESVLMAGYLDEAYQRYWLEGLLSNKAAIS